MSGGALILANGPSLLNYDIFDLDRCTTFAMNRLLFLNPTYYCIMSGQGWEYTAKHVINKRTKVYVQGHPVKDLAPIIQQYVGHIAHSDDWNYIDTLKRTSLGQLTMHQTEHEGLGVIHDGLKPRDTTYFTLRLALALEYSPIYILGLDMLDGQGHFVDPDSDGNYAANRRMWNEDVPEVLENNLSWYEIYNCNPLSGVTAFPYREFHHAFKDCKKGSPWTSRT